MAFPASSPVRIADVISLIDSSVLVVVIIAIAFSAIGAIAVWRAGQRGAMGFFRMFERLQVLQILTVMLVIASATVLALLGFIDSNGIVGLLSGVTGYVLGGLNRTAVAPPLPPAKADDKADASPATPGPRSD